MESRRYLYLLPGLDLRDRVRHQLVHGALDLVVGLGDVPGIEIFAQLRDDAGALDFGEHDVLGVDFGIGSGEAKLLRGPQADELVAPGIRLELELLVVRELLFEAFLALVEGGHGGPRDGMFNADISLAYRGKIAKSTGSIRFDDGVDGKARDIVLRTPIG